MPTVDHVSFISHAWALPMRNDHRSPVKQTLSKRHLLCKTSAPSGTVQTQTGKAFVERRGEQLTRPVIYFCKASKSNSNSVLTAQIVEALRVLGPFGPRKLWFQGIKRKTLVAGTVISRHLKRTPWPIVFWFAMWARPLTECNRGLHHPQVLQSHQEEKYSCHVVPGRHELKHQLKDELKLDLLNMFQCLFPFNILLPDLVPLHFLTSNRARFPQIQFENFELLPKLFRQSEDKWSKYDRYSKIFKAEYELNWINYI